jgi:hypothetical protein
MENGAYYIVRNRDSHAWPEVYFEGAGWVPFEPTVSQPEFILPLGSGEEAASGEDQFLPTDRELLSQQDDFMDPEDRGQRGAAPEAQAAAFPTQWVALAVSVLLVVFFFVYRRRMVTVGRWRPVPVALVGIMHRGGIRPPYWLRRWALFEQLTPLERIFSGVPFMLRLLGGSSSPSQTPAEQINTLVGLMPSGSEPAAVILEEYQRSIYSPYPPDVQNARQASSILWRQVFRTWLNRRLGFKIEVT